MCRSIKVLRNQTPPATRAEIEAAALQFVRKVSGTRKPALAHQAAYDAAVADIADRVQRLLEDMPISRSPRESARPAPAC